MKKHCPSCGANIAPESRFCRRCGTPLRTTTDDGSVVSPMASTVPLSGEGRTTNSLDADDQVRPSLNTTRVNRGDLDALLRSGSTTTHPGANDPPATQTPFGQPTPPPEPTQAADSLAGNPVAQTSALVASTATPPQADVTTKTSQEFSEAPQPSDDEVDEELTLIAGTGPGPGVTTSIAGSMPAAPTSPPSFDSLPQAVQPIPSHTLATPPAAVSRPSPPASRASGPPQTRSRAGWLMVAAGGVFLLFIVAALAWFGVGYFRKSPAPANINENVNAPPIDPKQLAEEKLVEAESLLAGGDQSAAIVSLREAIQLDPSNTKAHRRLGDILLDMGARREAIEEFRALTLSDPNDAAAWRSLARAQFDEGLHAEAAESYQRLIALSGEPSLTENELLSYADALRLSERETEARALYERLAASPLTDVAHTARQKLAELGVSPSPSASPELAVKGRENLNRNSAAQPTPSPVLPTVTQATPAPAPTSVTPPPPTPAPAPLTAVEHFSRGESLWRSNRSAALGDFRAAAGKGHRDAYYYLGLAIVEGRDPKDLSRPQLLQAMQYFQNARGGRFAAQANQYDNRLGLEFDRRKQQP